MEEEWRNITEIPDNRYFVSNLGNIKNNKGLIMSPNISNTGYYSVHLKYKGKKVIKKYHRLVMEYFKGYSELEVNHIDGDKSNNKLSNLEYVDRSTNMKHAVKNRLHTNSSFKGEKHNTAKYTFKDVQKIRDMYKEGFLMREISNVFGCSIGYVSDIVNFKTRIDN